MRIAIALAFILFSQPLSLAIAQSEELPPPRLIRRNQLVIPPSSGPIKKRHVQREVLDLQTIDQVQHSEPAPVSAAPIPTVEAPVRIEDYLQGAEVKEIKKQPRPMILAFPQPAKSDTKWQQPVLKVEPKWVQRSPSRSAANLQYQTPLQEDVWIPSGNDERNSGTIKPAQSTYVAGSNRIAAPPPPLEDSDRSAEYNPPPKSLLPPPDAHSNSAWQPIDSMTEGSLPYYTDSYYEPNGPCEECWTQKNTWVAESDLEQACQCPDCQAERLLQSDFAPVMILGTKGGNDRSLGEIQAMLPLWQSENDLLFGDLQGRFSDSEESEGHFGLGFRTYLSENWIFGTYAYYDLRSTTQRNRFNQLSFGAEVMSPDWDFRINGYFPNSGNKNSTQATGISNGTIVTNAFQERAYRGVDAEIGRRILRWGRFDNNEVRWFVGLYSFDTNASGFRRIDGPRTRVEYRCYDLPFLGPQSRLTAGFDYTNDNVRNDQYWGYLRVQIPLAAKSNRKRLDPVRRRFMDPTVRIID